MSLKEYNQKRDFSVTLEPKGINRKSNKKRFCIQHHRARKDHYDFRLEYNGVLLSWSVPKGPSYNPKDKRLAIQVEDHPISYLDFEGVIPEGYGKGIVMLWDLGTYEEIEPFSKTLKKGYLKFILHGIRCNGTWTLINFKDDNYLLIKEKDNIKGFKNINEYNTSIKSNLTIEEIKNNQGIIITNPNKIIYKKGQITKQDIVNYYEKVYSKMKAFLDNRFISTVRCPDGTSSEKFFKKHFKENKYLKKHGSFYSINDINGLIYEVQMNSIEYHIGASCFNSYPNYMVFDLDPDEKMTIKKVREGVKDLKKVLDELSLPAYLKTSGGKGYHIIVPFKKKITWSKFKKIAKNIALILEQKYPSKYTTNIRKNKRTNKIFIDWIRNTKGASSVAPYSLRAKDNPTVSMPIKWSELDKIKPDDIDINEALRRLKLKDPWKNFWK